MRISLWALATVFLLTGSVAAQPASFAVPGARSLASVDVLQLSPLDNAALYAEAEAEMATAPSAKAYRFAAPRMVTVTTQARGTWETLDNGQRVWRLIVNSPGAFSQNFGFSRFRLPEGARLWIYQEGKTPEYRPFTSEDNEDHGSLWTPIVPGDRAVIEVEFPQSKLGVTPDFELTLSQVGHAFRPSLLTKKEVEDLDIPDSFSGSCNVDVVCPEGDGYRDIIRSSGAYTRGGIDICSGSAINNTAQDGRPLFLTADHCGNTAGNAASVVVYWNYQNSTCRPPGSASSGGAGNGSRGVFNSGTSLVATLSTSDWALLEFDDPILPSAQVYLSGWDRRDIAPTSVIGIHHPGVEEKRISFENDPTTITNYLQEPELANGTHIRVIDWDTGTTEGGSSGSPLYNTEKRIVGQLHGGFASCTSQTSDWYGRMFRSMNDGLEAFLDPTGSDVDFIDGKEATASIFGGMSADPVQAGRGETVTFSVTVSNNSDVQADGIQFTNALPAALSVGGNINASAGTASSNGDTISWSLGLFSGESATLTYDVQIDDAASVGAITNVGVLEHPTLDPSVQLTTTIFVVVPPTFEYTNTTTAAITDNACPTMQTSTVNVTDDFAIETMKVGVSINHTWRGDLRVSITSPGGITANLIDRVGVGANGTSDDNLDALISDLGPVGAFGSGNHNTAAPYYDVEGQVEKGQPGTAELSPLNVFNGESAMGTWTLGVCDGAGQDTGSLQRWGLQFFNSTGTAGEASPVASGAELLAPQPNPFSTQTTVQFRVPTSGHVTLSLYDARGRFVRTLHDGMAAAGEIASVDVTAQSLTPGVYFIRLSGAGIERTQSLTVVR